MNILIVKLSAIGDVIHTLPALAALRQLYPDADIAWVVEEAAADLLAGHPDLDRILVSRRKTWLKDLRRGRIMKPLREMLAFFRDLRSRRYDLVIDFHGLFKSSLIVALSGGKRKLGYASLQEGSGLFYNEKIPEDLGKHAVDRYLDFARHLAGEAQYIRKTAYPTVAPAQEKRDKPGGGGAVSSSAIKAAAPEFRIAIGEEERRRVAALLDECAGILTAKENGGVNAGMGLRSPTSTGFGKGGDRSAEAQKEARGEEKRAQAAAVGEFPQRQGAENEVRSSRLRGNDEGRDRKSALDEEESDFGRLDFVAVNPIAFWETKLWEDEKFAELCDRIRRELGFGVILTGGEAGPLEKIRARMKTRAVNLGGKTSLRELAFLYSRAALVVSTDSGPMHLAAAAGTPVVALFGPTDPARTGPYGPGHRVIRREISCSPCFRKRCEDPRCMKEIGVEEVFDVVREMLKE